MRIPPEGGRVCIPPYTLLIKLLGGGGLIHQFGVWLGRELKNRLLLLLLLLLMVRP
jgi:hypothetical protein